MLGWLAHDNHQARIKTPTEIHNILKDIFGNHYASYQYRAKVYISDKQPLTFKGPQCQTALCLRATHCRLYKEKPSLNLL